MNTHETHAAHAASSAQLCVSGRRGRVFFVLAGLVLFFAIALLFLLAPQSVNAQDGNPPNQPRRGLVYDGLKRSKRAKCPNGFDVRLGNGKKPLCTHGPDPVPEILMDAGAAPALAASSATQILCDGDGVSGKRFQVLYVRAADMPDQFAAYENSIQQWIVDADNILNTSAAETGGTRHFRFVHDANCNPVVLNITVSPGGDDTFNNLIAELQAQGLYRQDRNYVAFTDASLYCGIATIGADESPWAANIHNYGSYYARIDARCWSAGTVAHEMMHTLGSVQQNAPHATKYWHCTDEHDLMCYQDAGATVLQYICDTSHAGLFDCNHEDYFNTNPAPNSYLDTHWNTAFNEFLVYPREQLALATLTTGKLDRKGNFAATNTFKPRQTALYRAVVKDANGAGAPNVRVTMRIYQPDGASPCNYVGYTDAAGTVTASCALARTAPLGTWQLKLLYAEKRNAQVNMTTTTFAFQVSGQ